MRIVIRDRSLWMGVLGCLVCFGVLQLISRQPWAWGGPTPQGVPPTVTPGRPASGDLRGGDRVNALRLIPFQGYLTDTAGRPVEGPHTLAFALYDDPTQGSVLWTESHAGVPVSKGLVNVLLGKVTSMDSQIFESPRYVGISVDGGLELVPRQQLIPSFWAADSDRARGLVKPGTLDPAVTVAANGSVGIGTVNPTNRLSVAGGADFSGIVGIGTPTAGGFLDVVGYGQHVMSLANNALDQWQFLIDGSGLHFENQGMYRLFLGSNGNVGIGTTTPELRLHVEGGGVLVKNSSLAIEEGALHVRRSILNVEANSWATIEANSNATSQAYTYLVLVQSATSGRFHVYQVLFACSNHGLSHSVLADTYVGNPTVTAIFQSVNAGGENRLQVQPAEAANVYYAKIGLLGN